MENKLIALDKALQLGPNKYYEGFDLAPYKNSLRAGGVPFDGLYERWVQETRPDVIVEVGSYLGYSAVRMAQEVKRLGLNARVICVDTWLGNADSYNVDTADMGPDFCYKNGYPTIYYRFLANVIEAGVQDIIRPFPFPSSIAAKILPKVFAKTQLQPSLMFIDGSHEEYDVFFDCFNYYPMLKPGGQMWGDDWAWETVRNGVGRFLDDNDLRKDFRVAPGNVAWQLKKPV
jgi:hypothetical protein